MRELGVTIIILDCLSINFLLRNPWFTCNVLLFYEITLFFFLTGHRVLTWSMFSLLYLLIFLGLEFLMTFLCLSPLSAAYFWSYVFLEGQSLEYKLNYSC